MKETGFLEHFAELRNRLILIAIFFLFSFFICYFYAEIIYDFLLIPLSSVIEGERRLIYTGLSEAFTSYIKLAFFIGIMLIFPYISWHIYRFISPALYKKERNFFRILIFSAPCLFYFGCFFAYYIIFPFAWKFFVGFENISASFPIALEARVSEYLNFSMRIIIAFGLVFQLPIIMVMLIKTGIISVNSLAKKRKYALLFFFIIGAVITPPDVISQLGIAFPMYILFELTLLLSRKI